MQDIVVGNLGTIARTHRHEVIVVSCVGSFAAQHLGFAKHARDAPFQRLFPSNPIATNTNFPTRTCTKFVTHSQEQLANLLGLSLVSRAARPSAPVDFVLCLEFAKVGIGQCTKSDPSMGSGNVECVSPQAACDKHLLPSLSSLGSAPEESMPNLFNFLEDAIIA